MEITYRGKVTQKSTNTYVNARYPVGTRIEVNHYWFSCGWLPILNTVFDSAILDLKNVEWETNVEVSI